MGILLSWKNLLADSLLASVWTSFRESRVMQWPHNPMVSFMIAKWLIWSGEGEICVLQLPLTVTWKAPSCSLLICFNKEAMIQRGCKRMSSASQLLFFAWWQVREKEIYPTLTELSLKGKWLNGCHREKYNGVFLFQAELFTIIW